MISENSHALAAEDILAQLASSATGLSAQEAATRLAANGPNTLVEGARLSPLRILLSQFKSLIVWILIVAGAVSFVLHETVDAIAIFAIVVLNAAIGFYQEFSAARSIATLKQLTAPLATVLREGQMSVIPAAEVVVGDILCLEAGALIAADARLLRVAQLQCNESALTGESEVVSKHTAVLEQENLPLGDRANLVFQGTSVTAGTGQAVVVATAMATELGKIAGLLGEANTDKDTPLQRKLDAVGRILVWAALGMVTLLFLLGLLRGVKLYELTMTSVSLAVAAIPEGLPAVVTVALSLGVQRLSQRHALMRKLAAVETLGSTSVICTDKTGTLTVGEMTVRALSVSDRSYEVTGDGYDPQGDVYIEGTKAEGEHTAPLETLATVLLACNHAQLVQEEGNWKTVGDPTEGALLVAGLKAGGDQSRIEQELPLHQAFPFDSDRKRSTIVRRKTDDQLRAFVNGAPGPLLECCTQLYTHSGVRRLEEEDRKRILAETSRLATQALRVLGSAYRDLEKTLPEALTAEAVEHKLVFVGLTGMYDPPRPEGRQAIATCHKAGIRVVMITGDHPRTALAIGQQLGIRGDTAVLTGVELDTLSDEALQRRVPQTTVYARVTAEHKLRIVRALQAGDAVVAMTGDGVNDAPAIRGADIGIAMGQTGTEVTKQAADMILADDNFATIVAAVEEGRGVYENIRRTLEYLLSGNTGELLLMTTCVVIGLPAPLLPIHLLWINLVTDGLPALCLATEPIDPDVMQRQPRHRSAPMVDARFLRTMLLTGLLTAGAAFAAYVYTLRTETVDLARTRAFSVLVCAELLRSFGARSETKYLWQIPLRTNVNLVIVVALSLGILVWSQQSATLGLLLRVNPVSFGESALLFAISAIPLGLLELVKAVRNARHS